MPASDEHQKRAMRKCQDCKRRSRLMKHARGPPAAIGIWDPYINVRKIPGNYSEEIPLLHSSKMVQGPFCLSVQRSFPSPSQRRQLDNFNYFDDGGIADRRCGPSAGPRPPRQCAKLTSQSSRQKRSGAGSPSNVWGKGSSSLLHLLSDCMQVD